MGTFSGSGRREFLKWVLASGFSTVLLDKGKTWAQNPADTSIKATLILHNGRIATQDGRTSFTEAVAIRDNRFLAVGSDREVMAYQGAQTELIDLKRVSNAIDSIDGSSTYTAASRLLCTVSRECPQFLCPQFLNVEPGR